MEAGYDPLGAIPCLILSRVRFSEKPAPRITARLHGHVSARFFGTHTYHAGSDLLGYGKRVPPQTAEDGKSGSSPLDHKISGAMHRHKFADTSGHGVAQVHGYPFARAMAVAHGYDHSMARGISRGEAGYPTVGRHGLVIHRCRHILGRHPTIYRTALGASAHYEAIIQIEPESIGRCFPTRKLAPEISREQIGRSGKERIVTRPCNCRAYIGIILGIGIHNTMLPASSQPLTQAGGIGGKLGVEREIGFM